MANGSPTNSPSDGVKILRDTVAAREKLREALAKLEQEITSAEYKSAQEFAIDVVKTGVIREQAVQKFNSWKAENERLTTQRSAIQHFRDTIENKIREAKRIMPDDLAAVLEEEIARLKQSYSQEKGEADTLGKRIDALVKELKELEPMQKSVAKRQ